MGVEDDDRLTLLVLHGLRLSGFAPTAAVGRRWALAEDRVTAALEHARAEGWATYREGRLTGWSLSAAGRRHAESLLAREVEEAGARPAIDAAYRGFLDLNQRFLDVCTEWQLRTVEEAQVVNDHTDADHDRRVIGLLEELHPEVCTVVGGVASLLDRFTTYEPRFSAALDRVRANDVDWFTKPVLDSYHTVWFELHEDFLATLGIERSAETSATTR